MKPISDRFREPALALLSAVVISLLAGAALSLTRAVTPLIYGASRYVILPLFGAWTAYRTVRRGVNPYLAFPVPAICWALSAWAVWGMLPDPGSAVLTFFVSLVGSAAGDVKNREKKKR